MPRRHRGISSQTALWIKLREQHFDMAVAFSGSRHSSLMAFASGAAVRAGFSGARLGRLLTDQIPKSSPSTVETYLELVQSVGCRVCGIDYRNLLDISPAAMQAADALLSEAGVKSTFALVGGKSTFNASRQQWIETVTLLAAKIPVVFVGGGVDGFPDELPVYNLGGKIELPVLAALCGRATICVGNENGILHLAACMNTPVVGIDDSADGRLIAPRGISYRLLSADAGKLQPAHGVQAVEEVIGAI
jgi:ADP-heptose:LPS heptosyltransferase